MQQDFIKCDTVQMQFGINAIIQRFAKFKRNGVVCTGDVVNSRQARQAYGDVWLAVVT